MTVKTVHLSNLAIPPGEHLQEETEYRGISAEELAAALEMTDLAVAEVFCGDRPVTPTTATNLERLLGISAQFWLNLEARYRLTLANNLEVYGHANPFDGPESEWPELPPELQPEEPEPEVQAALPE